MINNEYKKFVRIAKTVKLKLNPVEIHDNPSELSILKNNIFCSKKIYNYIIKHCKTKYFITFDNNYLNYYCDVPFKDLSDQDISKMHNICFIVSLMKKLTKNYNSLTINFYSTPFKKIFSKKSKILNEDNCNSGSSLIGQYNISIWRNEEYQRVLFHECLHALECDNILLDYPHYDTNIAKHFCLKSNINFCETYTETWATLFNLFYYGYKHDISNIHSYYLKELNYSIKLAKSILQHYGYKTIDELFSSDTCRHLPQKTSVFNYYICKPFFLYHIDDFLKQFNIRKLTLKSTKQCDKLFSMLIKYFQNVEVRLKIDDSKGNAKSLKMVFY